MRFMLLPAIACTALAFAAPAEAQVTRAQSNPQARILDGADVKAGTDLFYLSGQLASPIDPAKTFADVKSIEDLGDTKTQTISTLNRIKTILDGRGYAMSHIIKLTLFVAADPKLGKMDFAGANEGFKQFFKTADNPNTVARSTFQVAALAGPYFLIEIEAIAAKKR
jgi:enamine deaminase RidA (YjgF/YER057c/UK114 family)